MTDSSAPKPPRRARYQGTHPRQFQEKYKEQQPEKYAEDVAKIVSSGKTPAGTHRPVLLAEVLEALRPQPGEIVADATLGYGGHARELLSAIQPGGRLFGVDADPIELPKTEARLRKLDIPPEALIVRRLNYAGLPNWLSEQSPEGVDMVLADFGCSSMQLDNPQRGFSYKLDGPLDMRMNPDRGLSAAQLLSKLTDTQLATLLRDNADEPNANKIAAEILWAHRDTPLTTRTLTDLLKNIVKTIPHPVGAVPEDAIPRVFQALRIAVNDEFSAIDKFLLGIPYNLKPGGRLAVISFHSGEDRRVKLALKQGLKDGLFSEIAEEIITPSDQERHANPRSKSAKLRWAVRS